jgi:hypothetical protein
MVEETPVTYGLEDVTYKFEEYSRIKSLVDQFSERQKELRDELMRDIDLFGSEDDKGHLWFYLDRPVNDYVSLQKQRKVTRKLDEEFAESLISSRGLVEKCYKMVPVLDEQAIMAAHYEGLLSEEEIDNMFPMNVSYAFIPKKK